MKMYGGPDGGVERAGYSARLNQITTHDVSALIISLSMQFATCSAVYRNAVPVRAVLYVVFAKRCITME